MHFENIYKENLPRADSTMNAMFGVLAAVVTFVVTTNALHEFNGLTFFKLELQKYGSTPVVFVPKLINPARKVMMFQCVKTPGERSAILYPSKFADPKQQEANAEAIKIRNQNHPDFKIEYLQLSVDENNADAEFVRFIIYLREMEFTSLTYQIIIPIMKVSPVYKPTDDLGEHARDFKVGLWPELPDVLDKIRNRQTVSTNFSWLSTLLEYGIYEMRPLLCPQSGIGVSRPIVVTQDIVDKLLQRA